MVGAFARKGSNIMALARPKLPVPLTTSLDHRPMLLEKAE